MMALWDAGVDRGLGAWATRYEMTSVVDLYVLPPAVRVGRVALGLMSMKAGSKFSPLTRLTIFVAMASAGYSSAL